ncbi:MAG TPA: alpha-amylase family glycosyl hydrolase [Anaerolineae bacterium]|nr:alpha-amylase family glycosyl hydrolase [Anaerolineae bacterium]
MHQEHAVRLEFHISRRARERYDFDQALFGLTGNVVLADFYAVRVFAQKMNEKRDLVRFPEQAVRAGQVNAMGLIDELSHYVVELYRRERNPDAMALALAWLDARVGRNGVDRALRQFADEFPPLALYRGEVDLDEYMVGETEGVPNREILLEEMLMLWLANSNPAFSPFLELFDDDDLERETVYPEVMDELYDFFETQPRFGPDDENLVDLLLAPVRAHPHSLLDQLEFIRRRWMQMLGGYFYRLLGSMDLIQEEERAVFAGPGPALVLEYAGMELEPERFSRDLDWMPRLVMLAKNIYVWMHQLADEYGREIHRLDQIPDEELDTLARWGFSGLWLIGIWERSPASQEIKQRTGNPEAVASAYSLYDYDVAADLGGMEAYQSLRQRAMQRGIRMASDMVPNHVGIYSRWVIEHPDWFISLDYSPFPSYSFYGPDLSRDGRVGIFIEDHYYDRTDAAVVFKRLDRWTGSEKYIYHGNDGTSMPWNDTAQLNYLNPEVREAVIQTILHVARHFSIIRFDAAMTLAKRHFQRLWFPEPGTGGAIPTRAEHGLTKEQFDAAMPVEFWREVVDRVAQEAPDTLLLAEAFWLLEGYFVRTLGMHRVYNSAFMNMLRDEENAKYRSVMKNTLEFDPEVLKRFVNFMNNPDEETAVAQFGKGDKYFGVTTVMVTLPGLPMFGHGQIQGLAEKYGMEYRRAYWDEEPDPYLIERHEREIFPLLHRRHIFAEVEHFLLYDFFTPEGHVNEDVFAYSNRWGDERALVVYHNRYASARGWIKTSVAYSVKTGGDGDRTLVQRNLREGLGLHNDPNYYVIFRDHVTGLEYLRNSTELWENGLYVEVDAYKYHVFVDWREVADNEWRQYGHLAGWLAGRGVPSIDDALRELFLQPIHQPFRELVNAGALQWLIDNRVTEAGGEVDRELIEDFQMRMLRLVQAIDAFTAGSGDAARATEDAVAEAAGQEVAAALQLPVLPERFPLSGSRHYQAAVKMIESHLGDDAQRWSALLSWIFVHPLGRIVREEEYLEVSRTWMDEWLLGKVIAGALGELGLDEAAAWWTVGIVKIATAHAGGFRSEATEPQRAYAVLDGWLRDSQVQQFLQVNRHRGMLWFNHESFEQLTAWMLTIAAVQIVADPGGGPAGAPGDVATRIVDAYDVIRALREAEAGSGYQVEKMLARGQG